MLAKSLGVAACFGWLLLTSGMAAAHGPYPHHPVPGPYCYHAPQSPECHYHPGAAYAAGVATGAAVASASRPPPVYVYPIPSGQLPPNCYINSSHTEMICSVPIN